MRELDRWYAAHDGPAPAPRSRHEGWRRFFVGCATTALVTVASLVVLERQGVVVSLDQLARLAGLAPTGADAAVSERGTYAFLQRRAGGIGGPVTYDGCQPVRVVVNDAMAPPGSDSLLRSALGEMSRATGMTFTLVGTTDELPGPRRPLRDGDRYGRGWSPVLVAWTTPEQLPALDGDVVGIGGSVSVTNPVTGRASYVTGSVGLDTPSLERTASRGGDLLVRAVILHELGHVMGLDHVNDPDELMSAKNLGRTELGPGDRAGLAILGRSRCTQG
jgi:hypothetical protein